MCWGEPYALKNATDQFWQRLDVCTRLRPWAEWVWAGHLGVCDQAIFSSVTFPLQFRIHRKIRNDDAGIQHCWSSISSIEWLCISARVSSITGSVTATPKTEELWALLWRNTRTWHCQPARCRGIFNIFLWAGISSSTGFQHVHFDALVPRPYSTPQTFAEESHLSWTGSHIHWHGKTFWRDSWCCNVVGRWYSSNSPTMRFKISWPVLKSVFCCKLTPDWPHIITECLLLTIYRDFT